MLHQKCSYPSSVAHISRIGAARNLSFKRELSWKALTRNGNLRSLSFYLCVSVCGRGSAFQRSSSARNSRNSFRVCGSRKHANKGSIPLAPFRCNDAFVYLVAACANAAYNVSNSRSSRPILAHADWYYSPSSAEQRFSERKIRETKERKTKTEKERERGERGEIKS